MITRSDIIRLVLAPETVESIRPTCGAFFTVYEDGSINLNSDPLQRCDQCDPYNVDLEIHFWDEIPRDAVAICCESPDIDAQHDTYDMLQLKCSNCELTIYEDVSIVLLESVAEKGAESPLMKILFLSMLQQWNRYVADQPTTTKIQIKD